MIVTGALLTKPSQTNRPTSEGVIPAILVVGGAFIFVEGALFFIGGEIYDHVKKNRRYSIVTKQNEIGIAYNF